MSHDMCMPRRRPEVRPMSPTSATRAAPAERPAGGTTRRCCACATCTSRTRVRCGRCTACPSTCRATESSPCSEPTGPGRAHCCARSQGRFVSPAVGSTRRCRWSSDGRRLDRMDPAAVVRAGVVQVPEGRQVFADLTVEENLRAGRPRRAAAVAQAGAGAGARAVSAAARARQPARRAALRRRAADAGDRAGR